MPRNRLQPEHLGDGVYVHDQGHSLAIAVNHHTNIVIIMDDFVIKRLLEYAKRAEFTK